MLIDGTDIKLRMRAKFRLKADTPVGCVSCFQKDMAVDTDRGNRDVTVIATTDGIDMEREVVVPTGNTAPPGQDRCYFFNNRELFADHWYDQDHHVATLRYAEPWPNAKAQRGWKVRCHVFAGLRNPMADDLLVMCRYGAMSSSIGYEGYDYGRPTPAEAKQYSANGAEPESIVRLWNWLELSFTAFPCNVQCRTEKASIDESKAGTIEELLTKGKIGKKSAEMVGFPVRGGVIKPVRLVCGV